MERQPSFSRIIGGTAAEQKKILDTAESEAEGAGGVLYEEYIVESTEKERYAINLAVRHANEMAAHYGATRKVDPDRVHILEPEGVEKAMQNRLRGAMFDPFDQSAAINRTGSAPLLAQRVFHEALHLTSYQSVQIFKDGKYGPYRSGIGMLGREREGYYFIHAQEAIIAVLSRRFFEHIVANDPLYEREIERTAFIKDWIRDYVRRSGIPEQQILKNIMNIDEVLIFPNNEVIHSRLKERDLEDDYKMGLIEGCYQEDLKFGNLLHERRKERDLFNGVMDRIVIAGEGKIKKNELFDEFARAHFTGNYLPLARTIEGILGKGSFREIAIELGTVDEVEKSKK